MSQTPFRLIDRYPENRIQSAIVFAKVLLKEGLWHGQWNNVFQFGRSYGSLNIAKGLSAELLKRKANFIYNDFSNETTEAVVALRDVRNLKWAIEKKKQGLINRLIAGPFISTLPKEYDGILLSPEIDVLLFLSAWHRDLFLSLSEVKPKKAEIWYAGIDADFWNESKDNKTQVLIYDKIKKAPPYPQILKYFESKQLPVKSLHYGHYALSQFKSELSKSRYVIFLSESETQGLATLEAWSSGVPTLHWNPGTMTFMGKTYCGASSCPYLSESSGMTFSQNDKVEEVISEMERRLPLFSPRQYVLNRFTQKHSAELFLNILNPQSH